MLHYTILYYTILYYTILTILCYTIALLGRAGRGDVRPDSEGVQDQREDAADVQHAHQGTRKTKQTTTNYNTPEQ